MAGSRGDLPLERMREVLARRVEATSLRHVAREVGMSPTGLQKVLDGADSYSRTRRKLERWYVRESVRYGGGVNAAAVIAALRVTVVGQGRCTIPSRARRAAVAPEGAGNSAPEWLVTPSRVEVLC